MDPVRIGSVETPTNIVLCGAFGLVFAGAGVYILIGSSSLGGAIFTGIGALFVYGAAHSFLSRARYGEVALVVTEPVVPGGRLLARLDAPAGVAGATTLHAELRCMKVEWVQSGGKRSIAENAVWNAKQSFPLRSAGRGAHCDITFDMPADAPLSVGGTTADHASPGIYWELQVETENVPGVDLMRGFRFPVVAGTPAPSVVMRPRVPPVALAEQVARAAEAKKRYNLASKAAGITALTAGIAMFAFFYFAQPSGVAMRQSFFAVIAATMAAYWIITYRDWLRQKAENSDTPALTGAFIWHMIVLAIAGFGFL